MALKTRCLKCKSLIDIGNTYCEKCNKKKPKENKRYKHFEEEKEELGILNTAVWRRVRKSVLIRDMGCCRMCALEKYLERKHLEVHHIHKRVDREDLMYDTDNLVTLCAKHHRYFDNLEPKVQFRILRMKQVQ